MVSIVIVGMILGMSIAIYENTKNNKTADTIAREVADKMAEAHLDSMIPPDGKTGLDKVKVSCNSDKIIQESIKANGDTIGNPIDLYIFPTKVNADCHFDDFTFEARDGVTLGQITIDPTKEPSVSISKSSDMYKATIDKMSGAVNVEKQ